jgi:acyl-CoA reductase-like NAD-dependent aldehyde dehydrogenase
MLARAVYTALLKHGLPSGAFSLLHGRGNDIGLTLTKHPLTQAVAFTGSYDNTDVFFKMMSGVLVGTSTTLSER